MISLGAVHHVGLTVPDLAAGVAWYEKALGFSVISQVRIEEVSLDIVLMGHPGGTIIELFGMPGTTRTEPEYNDVATHLPAEGWRHLAIVVADIEAAVTEAQAQGIPVVSEITPVPPFGYSYVFLRDPFGNMLELVELTAKQ